MMKFLKQTLYITIIIICVISFLIVLVALGFTVYKQAVNLWDNLILLGFESFVPIILIIGVFAFSVFLVFTPSIISKYYNKLLKLNGRDK